MHGAAKAAGALGYSEPGRGWLWSETSLEADALREILFSKIPLKQKVLPYRIIISSF